MLKKINNKKRITLAIIGVATLLVMAGGFALAYQHYSRKSQQTQTPFTSPINYEEPTQEQKQQGEEAKIERIEKSEQAPAQTTGTAAISSLSQEGPAKDIVAQTTIQATNATQCTLKFSQQTNSVTKTAPVIFQPSSSTCAGFSVPASEFPAGGTWTAILTVNKSDGTTITSPTTQINITK